MKISGLDELAKSMRELERAISELDGNLASVTFDPEDPQSIEQAIQTAHRAIDEKTAAYPRNEMVMELAKELKENARASILERAAAARLEGDDDE